jgi:hypothetical protein
VSVTQPLPPTQPQQSNNGGFFNFVKNIPSDIGKGISDIPVVGKALGTALSWAGKPLQEVQSDYKFIHSMFVDHGIGAGVLSTLGVLGGGAIGTVLGPAGTALGADLGAIASRQILGRVVPAYKDSFDKSNDPTYLQSFGRDLAHGLSHIPGLGTLANTNTGIGQIVSGISDASFDFEADPLGNAGKVISKLKAGDNLATVKLTDSLGNLIKDEDGFPIDKLDANGKPVIHNTLPFATNATGLSAFLTNKMSSKIFTPEQYDQFMDPTNPMSSAQRSARQDIVNIATNPNTTNNYKAGLIEYKYGAPNQWSRLFIKALSTVKNETEFDQLAKQSLFSKEFADKSTQALGALQLPSRTLAKTLNEKWGLDRIRNSDQATNYNDQVNLLLPRKSSIMEPQVDASGNPIIDPKTGQQQMAPKYRSVVDKTTGEIKQEQMWKINAPALFKPGNGAVMNALAGKVRTFTNKRAMSYDTENNALSTEKFDPADPRAATTALQISSYALPHRLALENAGAMIFAPDDETRLALMHSLNQEVLKNFGVADVQASKLFSDLKDASISASSDHSVYYVVNGVDGGAVDVKPEYGDSPRSMGVVKAHRYQGSLLDLKAARTALRNAKAYGALYNPIDDAFTHYTNIIFTPLTLLSTAFGLRVSSGEALQQIMRRGLPRYIGDVITNTTNNLNKKYLNYHTEKMNEGLTETDKDAFEQEEKTGVPVPITSNEVTKELDDREKMGQKLAKSFDSKQSWNNMANAIVNARYRFMPLGWVAHKFEEKNLIPYFVKDKINAIAYREDVIGTGPTPAVSGAHNSNVSQEFRAADNVDLFAKTKGHGSVPGEELAGLTSQDPNYHFHLAKGIYQASEDEAQQVLARDYLNRMTDPKFAALPAEQRFASLVDAQAARIQDPAMFQDLRKYMDGYTKAVPESFAKAQIEHLQGLVSGADGTIHNSILRRIADGKPVTEKELKQLPQASLPIKVLGKRHLPNIADAVRRVEEFGYRKFVTPVMDYISRQPIFNDFYFRRWNENLTLVNMGLMSKEEAVRMSATQATRDMIPVIHSPAIRSQWAVMHRNIFPFYFAQEQALRRTGNLIMTNPQAFRDYQMIQQGMNNPGFVHTDANGQKYIVYPLMGEFGNALSRGLNALGMTQFTGLPESVTGNTASLLSVLPEIKTPGISPFANLALSQLSNMFPWTSKAVNLANGGYPAQNFIDTIMPNSTMRDLFNALNADERESTVYNSKFSAIAAAYYNGDLPPDFTSRPPFEQAQILSKIENNAKSNLIIKGLFSFFLPLSPTVSNDYYDKNMQTLRSDYLNLLNQKDPTTGQKYTAASALAKFLEETGSPTNPNRGLGYTVARSTNGTSGAYVPLADSTLDFIKNNGSILNNPAYSSASPYLIPQVSDSSDSLAVENKLILDHYRSKISSTDFINSLYVKQGWQDLGQDYNAYQTALAQARKSGDRQAEYQIGQVWKQVTANYGQSNPVWYADYNNPTRPVQSQKVISQFQTMDKKGLLPNTPEGNGIKELLASYQDYHNGLLANTVNGQHLPGYSNLVDAWYTYVNNLAAANPRLQSVISSIFRGAI